MDDKEVDEADPFDLCPLMLVSAVVAVFGISAVVADVGSDGPAEATARPSAYDVKPGVLARDSRRSKATADEEAIRGGRSRRNQQPSAMMVWRARRGPDLYASTCQMDKL